MPFSSSVVAKGNVEHWLMEVEKMMKLTLYDVHKACYTQYPTMQRKDWFFQFASQAVLTVEQIVWTNACTAALVDIAVRPTPRRGEDCNSGVGPDFPPLCVPCRMARIRMR